MYIGEINLNAMLDTSPMVWGLKKATKEIAGQEVTTNAAVGMLVRFWLWAMVYAPQGVMPAIDDKYVREAFDFPTSYPPTDYSALEILTKAGVLAKETVTDETTGDISVKYTVIGWDKIFSPAAGK